MTFFLVIAPFFTIFCPFVFFHILQMTPPIPILCTLYTPSIHTHMLFLRFCTLLCALVTVDTAYTIYFFLIHHCTNSLSSLHIFVLAFCSKVEHFSKAFSCWFVQPSGSCMVTLTCFQRRRQSIMIVGWYIFRS